MRRNLLILLSAPRYQHAHVQGEPSKCEACGAMVDHWPTHSKFHEALAQLARDVDSAQTMAYQADARARRGGW